MGHSQDRHLWKEVREQSSDKGLTASADSKESSGARTTLQSCPKSGQEGLAFIRPQWRVATSAWSNFGPLQMRWPLGTTAGAVSSKGLPVAWLMAHIPETDPAEVHHSPGQGRRGFRQQASFAPELVA